VSSTSVNPGRWLQFEASIELVGEAEQFAMDRESMTIVELAGLLQSFREDPSDPIIGRVRITIEPAH
jgi:hypothetical protein